MPMPYVRSEIRRQCIDQHRELQLRGSENISYDTTRYSQERGPCHAGKPPPDEHGCHVAGYSAWYLGLIVNFWGLVRRICNATYVPDCVHGQRDDADDLASVELSDISLTASNAQPTCQAISPQIAAQRIGGQHPVPESVEIRQYKIA